MSKVKNLHLLYITVKSNCKIKEVFIAGTENNDFFLGKKSSNYKSRKGKRIAPEGIFGKSEVNPNLIIFILPLNVSYFLLVN